jgi:hypothetical protein
MHCLRVSVKFLAIVTTTLYMLTLASLANAQVLSIDPEVLKWAELKNKSEANKRILTDAALTVFATKSFDAGALMRKSFLLGKYNNANVIASFPCADVCPTYTVRIIYLDVEPKTCKAVGDEQVDIHVPEGIWLSTKHYCIPKKIISYQKQ